VETVKIATWGVTLQPNNHDIRGMKSQGGKLENLQTWQRNVARPDVTHTKLLTHKGYYIHYLYTSRLFHINHSDGY
jgi:hypothetical protein